MKRILFPLVVVTLMAVAPVNAQSFRIGVKGGTNNTSLSFDTNVFKSDNRFGWFIGPTIKLGTPVGIGADISALYEQRSYKVDGEGITQKSVVVPVNARLGVSTGSIGAYVATGPQFGFNVGDSEFSWKDASSYQTTFQLKKSTFSWNLGAGVFVDRLEVGFTYNIALGKTADLENVKNKDDIKEKTWTLSACYYF